MASINLDIAKKIDIISRQNDSMIITLNMSSSSGGIYELANTFILFNIYNAEDENSIMILSNKSTNNNAIDTYFSGQSVSLYSSYEEDSYTVSVHDGISVNTSTGVVTINRYILDIAPGNYKYKMVLQTTNSIKTWMYGKFKVNE